LGALLVVVSIAYAFDNGDLVDLLLLIAGVVLVPAWGIWVAFLLSPARPRTVSAETT
jgi:hypothetical protein